MGKIVRCSLTRSTHTELAESRLVAFRSEFEDGVVYGIRMASEKHSYTLRMSPKEADTISRQLRRMLQECPRSGR